MAIISQSGTEIIEAYKKELEEILHKTVFLKNINHAARKYLIHTQAGRTVLVLKNSPIGKILIAKASIAEKELERAKRKEEFLKKFGGHEPIIYEEKNL